MPRSVQSVYHGSGEVLGLSGPSLQAIGVLLGTVIAASFALDEVSREDRSVEIAARNGFRIAVLVILVMVLTASAESVERLALTAVVLITGAVVLAVGVHLALRKLSPRARDASAALR